ncbi:hypothetical protein XENORESO_006067 [Xenotaenia resolanae]|uniref:Uncharacterized protein n=1 Tax=Xenotaenia resolanae TaxID=208358 RepID=A0ABV0X6G1_9TELE
MVVWTGGGCHPVIYTTLHVYLGVGIGRSKRHMQLFFFVRCKFLNFSLPQTFSMKAAHSLGHEAPGVIPKPSKSVSPLSFSPPKTCGVLPVKVSVSSVCSLS